MTLGLFSGTEPTDLQVCGTESIQKLARVERVARGDNACLSRESVDDALGRFDNDRGRTGVDIAALRNEPPCSISSANDHVHDEPLS